MKWVPSQLGADPKKVAILGGLVVVLAVVYIINRNPQVPQQQTTVRAAALDPAPLKQFPARPVSKAPTAMPAQRGVGSNGARRADTPIQDFKPTLKLPEGVDVSRLDPSLKLDLMAQLQQLPLEGGERSLFEFGAPPKPKTPTPTVAAVKPLPPPVAVVPPTPVTPPKPLVPPIPLKFYGYVAESQGPSRRAFFLDGDDIVVAGEDDVIRSRYKVVRIGVNSAIVEDTVTKNQQTLPLIEELPG